MDKKINKNDYKIIIDMMTTLFHLTVRSSHNTTMEILQDYLITTMHIFACLNKIGKLIKNLRINFNFSFRF